MADPTGRFTIRPTGPFSLEEAATFGFGQRAGDAFDGVLRLAFCLDGGFTEQVGVEVRQDDGQIHATVYGTSELAAVERQVARVLSLDLDGAAFAALGQGDPVVARLLDAAPGLRPPLFYSPYEAAAWVVMSARRPRAAMAEVRRKMSEAHGTSFCLAGQTLAALPTPEGLLQMAEFRGLSAERVARLHGVAEAARDGQLEVDLLHAMGPEAAMVHLQRLRGIGRFSAALIVLRASGFADVLPEDEPQLLGIAGQLYGLGRPLTQEELVDRSAAWIPYRTWTAVLVRAAGPRILAAAEGAPRVRRPWRQPRPCCRASLAKGAAVKAWRPWRHPPERFV